MRVKKAVQAFNTNTANIHVAWSPSGEWIAVADKADTVQFINFQAGQLSSSYKFEKSQLGLGEVNELAWSKGESSCWFASGSGQLGVLPFPPTEEGVLGYPVFPGSVYCLSVGNRVAALGGVDACIAIWDVEEGICWRTLGVLS